MNKLFVLLSTAIVLLYFFGWSTVFQYPFVDKLTGDSLTLQIKESRVPYIDVKKVTVKELGDVNGRTFDSNGDIEDIIVGKRRLRLNEIAMNQVDSLIIPLIK